MNFKRNRWLAFLLFVLLSFASILFLPLFSFSLEEITKPDYYNLESMQLDVKISNSLYIEPTSSDYLIKKVVAEISFFPNNDFRQSIDYVKTIPIAEKSNGTVIFTWHDPKERKLDYEINSRLRTYNRQKEIKTKVLFPIVNYPSDVLPDLAETETVDFKDPRIATIASELAAGQDDEYIVAHKFGEWVNANVKYDLNTVTSDATQKASWVIENKEGVCDEITNLFIAMCRSVGIPARFISGLSYTNAAQFTEGWNPHGWAEIYFPDYGWVPFDVTFGQFGYIDATHISLKEAVDANKSTSKYEWEARNVNIRTGKLNIETAVIETGQKIKPAVSIKTDIIYKEVGFGSYNIAEVTLTNINDYYVSAEIMFSRTEELTGLEKYSKYVLLKPKETKKIYWPFKVTNELNPLYGYTFTVSARTSGIESQANFVSKSTAVVYSYDEMKSYFNSEGETEIKRYVKDLQILCETNKEGYIIGETAKIACSLRNIGNVMLSDVKTCLGVNCETNDFPISQMNVILFDYPITSDGESKLLVKSETEGFSKSFPIIINSYNMPELIIEDINYSSNVNYKDVSTIGFKLKSTNNAVAYNIIAKISCPGFENEWKIGEMVDNKQFILNVAPKSFTKETANCSIFVNYEDALGKKYYKNSNFTVSVSGISFFDKIIIWFDSLAKKFVQPNLQM